MSGMTSQPCLNSLAAALKNTPGDSGLDTLALQHLSDYWQAVRELYYPFEEDCMHFHRANRDALAPFPGLHARFKKACDDYFILRHRNEPRGIGGTFFDDFAEDGFDKSFAVMRSVGDAFLPAYVPIMERRRGHAFGDRERDFQAYRRGRYVEFNLVWDRGTLFGLQSGGRAESILMSLPPLAKWRYDWQPAPGSPEEKLGQVLMPPRDWANLP